MNGLDKVGKKLDSRARDGGCLPLTSESPMACIMLLLNLIIQALWWTCRMWWKGGHSLAMMAGNPIAKSPFLPYIGTLIGVLLYMVIIFVWVVISYEYFIVDNLAAAGRVIGTGLQTTEIAIHNIVRLGSLDVKMYEAEFGMNDVVEPFVPPQGHGVLITKYVGDMIHKNVPQGGAEILVHFVLKRGWDVVTIMCNVLKRARHSFFQTLWKYVPPEARDDLMEWLEWLGWFTQERSIEDVENEVGKIVAKKGMVAAIQMADHNWRWGIQSVASLVEEAPSIAGKVGYEILKPPTDPDVWMNLDGGSCGRSRRNVTQKGSKGKNKIKNSTVRRRRQTKKLQIAGSSMMATVALNNAEASKNKEQELQMGMYLNIIMCKLFKELFSIMYLQVFACRIGLKMCVNNEKDRAAEMFRELYERKLVITTEEKQILMDDSSKIPFLPQFVQQYTMANLLKNCDIVESDSLEPLNYDFVNNNN
uniref:Uncharacterized protein n=1 Tax=Florenciella sp. virus SA2 TaxID=3240092 RepID=A0AB39J6G3_9VIRU